MVKAREASIVRAKVEAEAARRFVFARHFLSPARSLAGLDGVLEVIRRLGSIQFDPVAVAGRSHDLVLHARVAGYEPDWCDALIVEVTDEVARQAAPVYGPLVADAEAAHAVFDADELGLITRFIRIERGLLAKHTERVAALDRQGRASTEPR